MSPQARSGIPDHPVCNAAGRSLTKSWEKLRLKAYLDQGKIWTLGWGQTGPDIHEGSTCTRDEADAMFDQHMDHVAKEIDNLLTYELGDNQFSALCVFVYNIGIGAFASSKVLRAVNAGDEDHVPDLMRQWKYVEKMVSNGLINRREAEIELWETPDAEPDEDATV